MATRKTGGKRKMARKGAKSSARKSASRKRGGGRKMAASSRKRGTARKTTARKTTARKSARKRTARQAPAARVKRVAQEVVQQAQGAVAAGVETLKDFGENLMDRVRTN